MLSFPLGKEAIYLRQAGAPLPPGEESNSSQAGSQAGSLLPPREGSSSSQASTLLPLGEGSSISQAIAHLPPGEGSNSLPATAHLPIGEGSNSPPATAHLPPRGRKQFLPGNCSLGGSGNSQAGQTNNQARSGRQGFRHSTRHRAPQASQENSTASQADSANSWEGNLTPTTLSRLPQGSSNKEPNPKWVINISSKPLTPAQRSVLAKGPNFVVSPRQPPNLGVYYCHRSSLY